MIDDRRTRSDDFTREVSDENGRAQAVSAFLRDQDERRKKALKRAARRRRIRRARRIAVGATWIGVAYIWVGTPGWLTVEPPPVPTVADESNALRFNLYLQSQRVEAYRAERGRLPYVLDEAGPRFRGMEYRRRDNSQYQITGRTDRVELQYYSRQSPLAFVGEAASLAEDPHPRGER